MPGQALEAAMLVVFKALNMVSGITCSQCCPRQVLSQANPKPCSCVASINIAHQPGMSQCLLSRADGIDQYLRLWKHTSHTHKNHMECCFGQINACHNS